MPYRCDYCPGVERVFNDFRSYRMHCLRSHPGQPANKQSAYFDDGKPEAEAQVQETVEPVVSQVAAEDEILFPKDEPVEKPPVEIPEARMPYVPSAAVSPDIESRAEVLRDCLGENGLRLQDKMAETIVSSFIGFPEFHQDRVGLARCLAIHLKSDSPGIKAQDQILNRVFPPDNPHPAAV